MAGKTDDMIKSSFKKGHTFIGNKNRPRDEHGRFLYQGGRKTKKCAKCDNLILKRSTYCRNCSGSINSPKLRGSDSPSWKGGIYPHNLSIRRSFQYKQWAKKVKERDNYTCQICGVNSVYLHSDHIKEFSNYPELRFDLDNGRTLCVQCHRNTPNFGAKFRWSNINTNA